MKNQPNLNSLESISDIHRSFNLPKPLHPLISLIDNRENQMELSRTPRPHVLKFYKIAYKTKLGGRLKYGRGYYDFDEGGLMFASPNQVIDHDSDDHDQTGYALLIHPDFFLGHPLASKIRQYGFFSYSVDEALYLSESEGNIILTVFGIINEELKGRIDESSQKVLIAQIELLLTYAERFYKRQFITRGAASNDLLKKLERSMDEYFNSEDLRIKGIPKVAYFAEKLNISPSYLSDMLRSLTGQNTQHLIHHKLIERSKDILSTTDLTIAEIAFQLGFEHPQSFSRLFKIKTAISPAKFRQSFN